MQNFIQMGEQRQRWRRQHQEQQVITLSALIAPTYGKSTVSKKAPARLTAAAAAVAVAAAAAAVVAAAAAALTAAAVVVETAAAAAERLQLQQ